LAKELMQKRGARLFEGEGFRALEYV